MVESPISFSAEKVKKEILEDDDSGLVMKFIYKDREGKLEWTDNGNSDEKGGVLSFGDNPFKPYDIKIGRRMSRLPHSQKIEDLKSKLEAKEVFKIMMDKPCQSCGDAIHKKGIGSCGWCETDYGMMMKFDPNKDIKDNKWWDRQSETRKIFLWDELTNKNPYCRDCLYYYGLGKNYPTAFDKDSANYSLGNAVCEKHWGGLVAEGKLSKDTKKYSLYNIENTNAYEIMLKRRLGLSLGAEGETEYKISAREYFEKHDEVKNEHKYYAFFTIEDKGQKQKNLRKTYWAFYGRLSGYGRSSSLALLEVQNWVRYGDKIRERFNTYNHIGAMIPLELELKAIQKINEKYPSMKFGANALKPKEAGLNAYEIMLQRRMGMNAEGYTPTDNKQKWIKYVVEPFEINDYWSIPMKYPLPNSPNEPDSIIKENISHYVMEDGDECAWVDIKEFTVVDDKVVIIIFKYQLQTWNRDKEEYSYRGHKQSWGSASYTCKLPYSLIQKEWDVVRPKWIEWFIKARTADARQGHSRRLDKIFRKIEPKFDDYFSEDDIWRYHLVLGSGYSGGGLKKNDIRSMSIDDAFEFLEKEGFYNNPYERRARRALGMKAESFNPKSYLMYGGIVALTVLALFKRK